jgi:hypothetical protein
VTEADAHEFLLQLRGEFVGRMMVEMEPGGRTRIFEPLSLIS